LHTGGEDDAMNVYPTLSGCQWKWLGTAIVTGMEEWELRY